MEIQQDDGVVEMSQVVLSNGNGFIKPKDVCFLCGGSNGLKEACQVEDCCNGEDGKTPFFHPTCARQAGLEVSSSDEDKDIMFFGMATTEIEKLLFHCP
jgi:hypothetical protein